MRIGVISDTHGELPDTSSWPEVDVFVHAGDAAPNPTNTDADRQVQAAWLPGFRAWLREIRAGGKVFVPGNHDLFAEAGAELPGVRTLIDDAIPELALHGIAYTRFDPAVFSHPWAFAADDAGD